MQNREGEGERKREREAKERNLRNVPDTVLMRYCACECKIFNQHSWNYCDAYSRLYIYVNKTARTHKGFQELILKSFVNM